MIKNKELSLVKKIEILSCGFNIKYDKSHNGGYFSLEKNIIEIGIKDYDKDPLYTFSIISHELMECIFVMMGARYENSRLENNYLFNFNHQTFENAVQIHNQTFLKFIK